MFFIVFFLTMPLSALFNLFTNGRNFVATAGLWRGVTSFNTKIIFVSTFVNTLCNHLEISRLIKGKILPLRLVDVFELVRLNEYTQIKLHQKFLNVVSSILSWLIGILVAWPLQLWSWLTAGTRTLS